MTNRSVNIVKKFKAQGLSKDYTPIHQFKYWRVVKDLKLGFSKWVSDNKMNLGISKKAIDTIISTVGSAKVGARLDITAILTFLNSPSVIRLHMTTSTQMADALFYIFTESGYFE